jgi:hypothetical protein
MKRETIPIINILIELMEKGLFRRENLEGRRQTTKQHSTQRQQHNNDNNTLQNNNKIDMTTQYQRQFTVAVRLRATGQCIWAKRTAGWG